MRRLDAASVPLEGTTVIEASAGTGKTYTITSLFLRLLLERRLPVKRILVVTYTRAATAELRQRIRARLAVAHRAARGGGGEDPFVDALCASVRAREGEGTLLDLLEAAMASLDEAPVFTIHGFCQRVLSEHAFESGARPGAELTTHAGPILAEIADDYFTGQLYESEPLRAQALLNEPDRLRTLAVRTASAEDLRVLPEPSAEARFDEAAWRRAHARCVEIWQRERSTIVAALGCLKRASQYLETWTTSLERALMAGVPGASSACTEAGRAAFTRTGIRANLKKGQTPPEHPFFEAAEAWFEAEESYRRLCTDARVAFRRGFVDYLHRELDQRGRSGALRTFDGLLRELDTALRGSQGDALAQALERRYGAALVDEFQDTDPLQYRIFRRVFGAQGRPLFLIGDPKQAIYAFRGADVHAYLAARDDAGERVYTLDTNHRSDPSLIAALNGFYAAQPNPFALTQIAYQPVQPRPGARDRLAGGPGAPLEFLWLSSELSGDALRAAVTEAVAADIARLLAQDLRVASATGTRPLRPDDIAVLCRKNKQALALQQALSKLDIPSVFQGDASVFESDDAAELERVLEALAHPGSERAMRSFLCSWYGGLSAHELSALEADDEKWNEHRSTLQRLHEIWLSQGFMPALRGLVEHYGVEERLLSRKDGPRRVTNLWHLVELLVEAAVTQRLGPLSLLRWYRIVRSDEARRAELVGEDHELRLESGDDAVKLTTIHKSKGLEYPVVYCPFLWEKAELSRDDTEFVRFHDPACDYAPTLDLGSEAQKAHQNLATQETLAESLRLLYVALTRAEHRVCVVVPSSKQLGRSALGYSLAFAAQGENEASLRDANPHAFKAQLTELTAHLGPVCALRDLDPFAPAPPYAVRELRAPRLSARTFKRALDASTRVSSFSALITSRAGSHAELGLDHDAHARPPTEASEAARSPLVLDRFPRGAAAGQLIHEVLEHSDFCAPHEALRETTERMLSTRGYGPELTHMLTAGLRKVLDAPLDAEGLTLSQVSKARRRDEMEFVFPVRAPLTPRTLERVFKDHRAPPSAPQYAATLRELSFETLKGFLRGFIDLVFSHEGRFFIVDYKSNHLGSQPEDYAQDALARAMVEHHYYLQYHLYSVALHRHLRLRVPDYRYETHFGGVYYLFLRGMAPEHPAGCGVFFDRPSCALIEALDALLESGEGGRRP